MKRKMKETKDCRRKTECEWGCWRIIRCEETRRDAARDGTGRDAREDSARDDGEATRGRPRLAIEKMVLENFKSYAGAQHVGPFHKVRRDAFDARCESMRVTRRDDERGERLTATRARDDQNASSDAASNGALCARPRARSTHSPSASAKRELPTQSAMVSQNAISPRYARVDSLNPYLYGGGVRYLLGLDLFRAGRFIS